MKRVSLVILTLLVIAATAMVACAKPEVAAPSSTAAMAEEPAVTQAAQETKSTAGDTTYIGDYVSGVTALLDGSGISYEVGSKMGGNEAADFEAGVYGFPFFMTDMFYCIATTDAADQVESVSYTLKPSDRALDATDSAMIKLALQALDTKMSDEQAQAIIEDLGQAGTGVMNVDGLSVAVSDGTVEMERTAAA